MRGYTRASAFGPIADFVEMHGGSIDRVFGNVGLPIGVLDNPELPLPLAEQHNVLSEAAREIGDPYIGASLGQLVNARELGAYGAWMCQADSLAGLIDRCQRGVGLYLQTATQIRLKVHERTARFSIAFLDTRNDGWFQTELLGVSYLISCVRQFTGRSWSPALVRSTCTGAEDAARLETIFEAPVRHGAEITSIDFDAALLAVKRPRASGPALGEEPGLPSSQRLRDEVSALLAISLLEGYPKIDWVASKLDRSRRSLQRALEAEGCSFSDVLEALLRDRAEDMLGLTDDSVTEIALRLGYSDSAHFSRAFRRWTGMSPRSFRRQQGDASARARATEAVGLVQRS